MTLPAIDFSLFLHGSPSERLAIADALVSSFKQHGFARLVNYGIPLASIERLEKINQDFFRLPEQAKREICNEPSPNPQRGWSFKGAETTSGLRQHKDAPRGILMDEKEHFDAGPAHDVAFPNKWPDRDMPEFRQFLEPFHERCQDLCLSIMEACEVGLRLPEGTLTQRCQLACASELRLNYYPPVSVDRIREGRTRRTWPHTDFGLVTLLWQDDVGGLKYQDRQQSNSRSFMEREYGTGLGPAAVGDEHDVFVPLTRGDPGEVAVNISDTFQRLTNDILRAGVHTVDWPSGTEGTEGAEGAEKGEKAQGATERQEECALPARHSSVFFFKAHRDTSVGVLPAFVTQQTPARYDDITALQFHQRMTHVLIDPIGQQG
ncbi:related to iron/ascorbate family oxidoreductases [Rhynchosporium agropyri]|uniref:Related to iron/ascorbate family oxidoreductases n=1 Tax=Rhynchosporium agropyri TaxID=914238 RepID=A0A1E1JYC5_9HELO|nr:related to iron/ascorbate family oxidoreductases [Rhynchosporium agropyri]